MSALPALPPLQIVPAPRPRFTPAPLPGHSYPPEDLDARFVQDWLEFDDEEADEPAPRTPSPLPDPETVCGPLAQALVEVLAGRRPVVQMVRWASPTVYAALTARASVAHRRRMALRGSPVRVAVRRVIVTRPRDEVAEVSIVVIDGTRVRAIAMQLRGIDGRWIVDALQVG
jgi:hypothetical protein